MAVTANQITRRADGCLGSLPVAASTRLYEGTLAFIDSNGRAAATTGSGANDFAGVVKEEVDNSSGAAGAKSVELHQQGVFHLVGSGFTQADVGKDCWATDNYTIVVADTTNAVKIGKVVGYISATVLAIAIDVKQPARAAALTTALTVITPADAEGTPDYAIQAVTNSSPYGLVSAQELITLLYCVKNTQTRVNEIDTVLRAHNLVAKP